MNVKYTDENGDPLKLKVSYNEFLAIYFWHFFLKGKIPKYYIKKVLQITLLKLVLKLFKSIKTANLLKSSATAWARGGHPSKNLKGVGHLYYMNWWF